MSVEEPASSPLSVSLNLTRSGSYGLAEVTWAITTVSADFTDIGATSGVVRIPHGSSSAQLDITVLPDDMPEITEALLVTLVTVNQDSQMIRTNQVIIYYAQQIIQLLLFRLLCDCLHYPACMVVSVFWFLMFPCFQCSGQKYKTKNFEIYISAVFFFRMLPQLPFFKMLQLRVCSPSVPPQRVHS